MESMLIQYLFSRGFQICSLWRIWKKLNRLVFVPSGGKLHCKCRHTLPLPRLASASGVPSMPSPIPEPRDRVTFTWRVAPTFFFLFSFFFAAQSISSGGIAHSAIRQLTGVPGYSRWYCKQCVLLRGTCAVRPWPSRGSSCGLLFENFNRFCAMQLFHTLQAWLPPHDLSATLFVFGEGPFYVTYSIFSSNNRCTIQSFLSSCFVVLHEHG